MKRLILYMLPLAAVLSTPASAFEFCALWGEAPEAARASYAECINRQLANNFVSRRNTGILKAADTLPAGTPKAETPPSVTNNYNITIIEKKVDTAPPAVEPQRIEVPVPYPVPVPLPCERVRVFHGYGYDFYGYPVRRFHWETRCYRDY